MTFKIINYVNSHMEFIIIPTSLKFPGALFYIFLETTNSIQNQHFILKYLICTTNTTNITKYLPSN